MIPEIKVLRSLLQREQHTKYRDFVPTGYIKTNHRELWLVYQSLDLLMRRDIVTPEFSVADLEAFHAVQFPNLREKEKDAYNAIFRQLSDLPLADGVSKVLLDSLAQRAYASKVALQAFEFSEGRVSFDDFKVGVEALTGSSEVPMEELRPVTTSLAELYKQAVEAVGLRWRLGSLNLRLGSLRKGNFGFVFARPETGKTTLLASEATYMAIQAKAAGLGPVLWFNNEQQGEEVMLRCYEAHFGLPLDTMLPRLADYEARFNNEVGTHLVLIDQAQVHHAFVTKACKRFTPSLVLFDQIDKVAGFEADRTDLHLGAIYIWARELAKEFCPVIGVCQADGSGEGLKWLTMANVANAKTSKQAEADWILGIGRINEPGFDYIRYLHLSKNKLRGDPDTNRHMRHDRWEVLLEPEKARYTDID